MRVVKKRDGDASSAGSSSPKCASVRAAVGISSGRATVTTRRSPPTRALSSAGVPEAVTLAVVESRTIWSAKPDRPLPGTGS